MKARADRATAEAKKFDERVAKLKKKTPELKAAQLLSGTTQDAASRALAQAAVAQATAADALAKQGPLDAAQAEAQKKSQAADAKQAELAALQAIAKTKQAAAKRADEIAKRAEAQAHTDQEKADAKAKRAEANAKKEQADMATAAAQAAMPPADMAAQEAKQATETANHLAEEVKQVVEAADRAVTDAEQAADEAEKALAALLALEGDASDEPLPSQLYPYSSEWPRDCRKLPPPELDDNYWRLARSAKHGAAKRWDKRQVFTIIYHGDTGTFERRPNYTYPWSIVRVCVSDPDYRLRYRLVPSFVELKAPSPDILARFQEESGQTGTSGAGASALGARSGLSLREGPPAASMAAAREGVQKTGAELAQTMKQVASQPLTADSMKGMAEKADSVNVSLEELLRATPATPPDLKQRVYQQQAAIAVIDRIMREMTGDVPVLAERARELRKDLDRQWKNLMNVAKDRPERRLRSATLLAKLAEEQALLKQWTDRLQEAERKFTEKLGAAPPSDEAKAALQAFADQSARAQQLQDQLAARQRELQRLAGEDQDDALNLRDALTILGNLRDHFALVTHNVFYVLIEQDRRYEIAIEKDRLHLVQRDLVQTNPSPAGNPPQGTGEEAGGMAGATSAAPTTSTPSKIAALEYEALRGQESRVTLQVRSMTYFRVNLGVVYSTLRQGQFSLTQNDAGAQVITRRGDQAILPLFLLSHYWCGVDLREIQPYHRFRECGWKNLLPTFTIGIPLSRNPIENLFVGTLWQPVPGLALTGGVHLGRTWVLQRGYVEGQPPPPPLEGQTFDVTSVQDQRLRLGYFLGIAITDSIFVKAVSALAGLNN